ncbi:PQQ-dependent sugar dehydrogenase [Terrimonas pollutisoli]|uniref:PQQ-dependent sugar dehydrogenase n=1 Tax=Terrimonas pollutisoli TaxID=3034147 RepID=UPI0023EB0866|nr:PQQ-dependent sugar dehydrogenase [Terrimonas sp. H1YJ31]
MKVSVLLILTILCVRSSFAQIVFADDDFVSTSATNSSSWNQPVGLLFSKNGDKLFVWEKAGKVYVCNRNSGGEYERQASPVIDISAEVGDYSDYGLTGFALDPNFESNGKIYLSYVVDRYYLLNYGKPGYNPTPTKIDKPGATIGRITSYTTSTNAGVLSANLDSRIVLLGDTKETGVPILHKSHGTGSLVFAADGTLLASMGDGASFDDSDEGSSPFTYFQDALADGIIRADENVGAWRSQKLTSLNGKLFRLDPLTGNGIISNPFYEESSPGSTRSRIWAFGLRNPFRISIQPGQGSTNPTSGHIGEIFVGEVGFGRWEELNIVKERGMNFGWPLFEGNNISYAYDGLGKIGNVELPIPADIDCGRPYVRFHEQLRQDNAAKDARVYYPCSSTLMGDDIRYIHARPVLEWLHAAENEGANARVGIFTSSGDADAASIGTPASNVTGNVFNGNASTGGIWYTGGGGNFPAEYANSFFMSDYGGRWIKRVTLNNNKVTKVDDFASNTTVVCMAENPIDGSLFYVDYGSGTSGTAFINKIAFGGNKPPVVKVKADKYFAAASNLTVQFDGTDSYDPDQGGSIASYAWDFDDGTTSTEPKPIHTFTNPSGSPKKFDVKLTVTDIGGASAEQDFIVSLNNTPPVASIISPIKNSKYQVGGDSTLALQAIINDAENNINQYEWQTILVHDEHTHAESTDPEPQTSSVVSLVGCQGDNYHWLIRLKVTDDAGLYKIDTSEIYPDCTQPLPIFLHKFSVTQSGSSNLIKWITELESSIEYFELERSENGINFLPINKQAALNNAGPNYYSFSDNSFPPGLNYYRLKIVEDGNIIRYSVIIRTTTDGEKSELKVVPNPVVDNFSLTYLSPDKDRVTIQIKDISGKTVHSMSEEVHKGQNVIYIQNLPTWLSGVYFISVQNKNEIKQAKFIKTK